MAKYINKEDAEDYILSKISEQRAQYNDQRIDVILCDIYLHVSEMETKEL